MLRVLSSFLSVCVLAVVIFLPYALGRLAIELYPDFSEIVGPEAPFVVIWIVGLGQFVVIWIVGLGQLVFYLGLYSLWQNTYKAIYEHLRERYD